MEFKSVKIENFRNFENVEVSLRNRNIFFGLNDVGKTNFLYAMRFLLDYFIRKDGFKITDFYNSNDEKDIKITLEIDLSNKDNDDTKKIIAKAGRSLSSTNMDSLFIQVKSLKDEGLYVAKQYWGGVLTNLEEIPAVGKSDLDKIFDVYYIDPKTDLDYLFKQAISMKSVLNRKDDDPSEFQAAIKKVNEEIENLNSIHNFENSLLDELKKYDKNTKLKLSSKDISLDPYKTIYPYLIKEDGKPYYVSGDGLRKMTSYSLHRLIALKNKGKRITVFLVEEPENHLHKTTLLKLAQVLFKEDEFPYLFLTTHSQELLSEMNKINLVRIASANKTYSHFYQVPADYERVKKMLNTNLARALFYSRVLLVEGPSEVTLFDALLTYKCNYKTKDTEILPVNGIAFKEYLNVLIPLNILTFIKTDNDIKKDGTTLGLNRLKSLLILVAKLKKYSPEKNEEYTSITVTKIEDDQNKRLLYESNNLLIDLCKTENIYLSKQDLEEDLAEALGDELATILEQDTKEDAVEYLKKSKLYNMVALIEKLTDENYNTIFDNENFKVLEVFIDGIL